MHRRQLAMVTVIAVSAMLTWAAPAAGAEEPVPTHRKLNLPVAKYVDVSVATSWIKPGTNRPRIDDAAISNPADPQRWVFSMSIDDKFGLNDLLETQSLYGTKVIVDEQVALGGLLWDHAWVIGQPTPRDTSHYGGYPGWIPDQQLTAQPPAESSGRTARVTGDQSGPEHSTASSVNAWAYDSPRAAMARNGVGRVMKLSFGTTLPVARARQHWVETLSNHGEHWYFNPADVSLTTPPATGARVVATARRFLGLGYLWAGTSGFGYDCSGFVHELYASLGVTIPRDTDAQAAAAGDPKYTGPVQTGSATGTWIPTMAELRPGDVVFFATDSGYIHHDGVYVGYVNGHPTMINSPHTGAFVEQAAIDTGTWAREFAGGGRYLPS
ncbi:MAG: C40 family peptidase [Dermatophilaceae bacterium]